MTIHLYLLKVLSREFSCGCIFVSTLLLIQVHGAHAGLTYWLREEGTDPALLEEARRIAIELEGLAPLMLRGLPLPSAEDNDMSGVLRAVARTGKTKKGSAVRLQLNDSFSLAQALTSGILTCIIFIGF